MEFEQPLKPHVSVSSISRNHYFQMQRKRPRSSSVSPNSPVPSKSSYPPASSALRCSTTFSGLTIRAVSSIQPLNSDGVFAVPKAKRPKHVPSSFSSVRSHCLTSKGFPTIMSPVTNSAIISVRLITDILVPPPSLPPALPPKNF